MAETIVKREGDPERRKGAYRTLAEIGFLRAEYKQCQLLVQKLQNSYENEKSKSNLVNEQLARTQQELGEVQEIIDADYLPEGAQPVKRIQKRDKLLMQVGQLESSLVAQKASIQRALVALGVEEKKLFQLDRSISQYVDALEDAEVALKVQQELDIERATKLNKIEEKRSKKWEKEQKMAIDARARQLEELKVVADTQVDATKKLRPNAVANVTTSLDRTKNVAKKVKESNDARLADRTEVVLEFKTNVDSVRAQVATQADKHNRKVAAAKKELDDEKEALLAKGINPYEKFRRRELDHEGNMREKHMKEAVEQNKVHLAERLIKEEDITRNEEAALRKAKAYEKKHRDEQGRHVIEERNNNYITSITTGNKEVLDPTGRVLRVDPSQITDIPDHSFGLGKSSRIPAESMKRITEKIRQQLNIDKDDIGEYQRLIDGLIPPEEKAKKSNADKISSRSQSADPSKPRSTPSSTDNDTSGSIESKEERQMRVALEKKLSELKSLASVKGTLPGSDNVALKVNFDDNQNETKELMQIMEQEVGEVVHTVGFDEDEAKYKLRVQSKFEIESFDKAKERQRQRLKEGIEQIAGGKLFKGQSFVPKPAEVLFKDFQVGKVYKKVFTLTNASYTFNSFRIIDLTDDVVDFFVITFDKPGRMSAGVSCPIEVTFTPKINQDIKTFIRFYTETGPIAVPLTCLIKRCAPRVMTPHIDFGNVVIGQIMHHKIYIKNTQALPTDIKVVTINPVSNSRATSRATSKSASRIGTASIAVDESDEHKGESNGEQVGSRRPSNAIQIAEDVPIDEEIHDTIDDSEVVIGTTAATSEPELNSRVNRVLSYIMRKKTKENPYTLSVKQPDGHIDGYNETYFEVTCAPLALGAVEQIFSVTFSGVQDSHGTVDEKGELVTREQQVTVNVVGEDVPVYLSNENVDVRTTLFDRIYRKRLEIRNRAKSAYRVNINIPAPYNKFIEVNPEMLFVQGSSSQFVNIKFLPTTELLSSCAHFTVPFEALTDSAKVAIPIQMEVVNQELPVYFVIRGNVTSSKLNISSKLLDFGKVYVNQASTLPLSVTNTSMLPQRMAFVRLKKEITVQPNDGFFTLLPNETVVFEVTFSPGSSVSYSLDMTLMTSFNDTYTVQVSAEGMEAPVVFSETVVDMRTTCPGERVLESIFVKNNTLKQQCFEIAVPNKLFTWLRIAPTVVDLAPGKGARIEIEYLPPEDILALDPLEWHQKCVDSITDDQKRDLTVTTPFDSWNKDSGWAYGKGMFGEVQWVSKMGVDDNLDTTTAPNVDIDAGKLPLDVPAQEWGVVGKYRLPVFFKQKGRSAQGTRAGLTATGTNTANLPFPMFINIMTATTLPQLVSDIKVLDFGMMAIGTRVLKKFKIGNMTHEKVALLTNGLNAVGPFSLITPPKVIGSRENKLIAVSCLPVQPGLQVEILELASSSVVGGHRLRITCRVQGVMPTIELKGLLSPPPNNANSTWSLGSGLLDLGDCVGTDTIRKKFEIFNKSTFAVEANIIRTVGAGLPPSRQAELIERSSSGGPIFLYNPERVLIQPQTSQEVEVLFKPDRGRLKPYREDLDIIVGQTDEILKVGLVGRSWVRQIYIIPADPFDEPFMKFALTTNAISDDLLLNGPYYDSRIKAKDAMAFYNVQLPSNPTITLDYPDPYADNVDAKIYVESANGRQQVRKILVCCAKINDSRQGAGNGTFEIALSPEAKESKLFVLSTEKGVANADTKVPVDITCTLPKPRGIGGLFVGSWKTYTAVVTIKGGWIPQGAIDEEKIIVNLKAFVCL